MQKLSVWEFKKYCADLSPQSYLLSTENQKWDDIDNTIRYKAEFCVMIINFNPNTIRFKSGDNYLKLERVKYIKVDEKSLLGDVFTIVCGNLLDNICDKPYTIIVR